MSTKYSKGYLSQIPPPQPLNFELLGFFKYGLVLVAVVIGVSTTRATSDGPLNGLFFQRKCANNLRGDTIRKHPVQNPTTNRILVVSTH